MRVRAVSLRDFRCYENARATLGDGLTIVWGPNGAGKTNLLEGIYFGCTGRSCRTSNEREVVRFGAGVTHVMVSAEAEDGPHELAVGFSPGEPKRMRIDGASVERLLNVVERPLVSVFLPDRLELIKGPPALRRSHLDQLVTALWPARESTRRAYAQALAQRNALLARVRGGRASAHSLGSWDAQLARCGVDLMLDRASAVEHIQMPFTQLAGALGLDGDPVLAYRPRSAASTPEQLQLELEQRLDVDLERGFTSHGPHRDDLTAVRDGRDLRAFGSQGQQRLALLALLLAEREALSAIRGRPPLMLLDDVMSELDGDHRSALVEVLHRGGQTVLTTTDLEHVPGANDWGVVRISIQDGRIPQEAAAPA